jgi:predicted methyltransferase MtxX (methanogen marker protein 4)
VDRSHESEPPQIGGPLSSLRAAIDVVARGDATRVTVHVPEARRLLPAASSLARRAGVQVELVEPADPESELSVLPIAAAGH